MIEIILLIAGGIVFILSFLIPVGEGKNRAEATPLAREEIRDMVSREMDSVKGHVDEVVEEAVTYAMEKTERSLERLSNEKIMAINEYSDTVLAEIHKSHEETMFLYDMLNSKHTNLKNTVSEVNRTVKEAEEAVNSFQRLTPGPDARPKSETAETAEERSQMPAAAAGEQARKSAAAGAAGEQTPKAAFVRAAEEQMAREIRETGAEPSQTGGDRQEKEGRTNSNARILALYGQGKDDVQIARELGLGVGEVKLVIGLFDGQS